MSKANSKAGAKPEAKSTCCVVVGMHRSGTSAVARGLAALGVQLGDSLDQLPADEVNAKGYFEDQTVVEINDALLLLLGSSWHKVAVFPEGWLQDAAVQALADVAVERLTRQFRGVPRWGFKDPRSARVLPFWQQVLERMDCEVRYVLVTRNPLSTAASLARRDQFSYEKSLWLWLDHMRLAAASLLDRPTLVIDYDRLMGAQRAAEWTRLCRFLDVKQVGADATDDYLEDFLNKTLQHSRHTLDELRQSPASSPWMVDASSLLLRLADDSLAWSSGENAAFWRDLGRDWTRHGSLFGYLERQQISSLVQKPGQAPTFAQSQALARRLSGELLAETAEVAICIHVHHADVWPEFETLLLALQGPFALYISLTDAAHDALASLIASTFPQAHVVRVVNRGRDMAPFLQMLGLIRSGGHTYVCKLHTKKSTHLKQGSRWRHDLLQQLLGSPDSAVRARKFFQTRPEVGMLGPSGHFLSAAGFWGGNRPSAESLLKRMGMRLPAEDFRFFAGSMFWCRVDALQPLMDAGLDAKDFEAEAGQVDGTLAHALERVLPLVVRASGLSCVEVDIETAPWVYLADAAQAPGGHVYIDRLLDENADLVRSYQQAESIAIDRLSNLSTLDNVLGQTQAALVEVTQLALDRLAQLEAGESRLADTGRALEAASTLSLQRLDELTAQGRRLQEMEAALAQVTRLSLERLDQLTANESRLAEMEIALAEVTRLSLDRLAEIESSNTRLAEADRALAAASQLSLQRLDEINAQARRLAETEAALAEVTQLSLERLAQMESGSARLADTDRALNAASELSLQRLDVINAQAHRLGELDAALAEVTQLAVDRLSQLEGINTRLADTDRALDVASVLSIQRLDEIHGLAQRLGETEAALAGVTQLAVDRLSQLEARDVLLANTGRELEAARQLSQDRMDELDAQARRLAQTQAELAQTQAELADVLASRSWRYTRPLRWLERFGRRPMRGGDQR